MTSSHDSVLIAGPDLAELAQAVLKRCTGRLHVLAQMQAIHAIVSQEKPAFVVLQEESVTLSLALLATVKELSPGSRVVFVAKVPEISAAVQLISAGAADYVDAFIGLASLAQAIASEEPTPALRATDLFFDRHCPPQVGFVGRSEAASQLLETIRVIAASRCNPILITGPTGTGKELAAAAVHYLRHGKDGRFVAVNCAALTANLLESELFGHAKGSFTGADREKLGLLEVAQGGSLFLDEISEMPVELQAKLLRVLQERHFRKVGGTVDIPCDATVIASSNRNLLEEVQKGVFRQDLYYRLAVFPIQLPPLASPQRRADIDLLANYFIATSNVSGRRGATWLSDSARRKLLEHDWPGNVRELKNVIERALIVSQTSEIPAASIIIDRPQGQTPPAPTGQEDFSLESAERVFIIRALREASWQRTKAAELLGITRATLHAKIKRYDIEIPDRHGSTEGAPAASRNELPAQDPL